MSNAEPITAAILPGIERLTALEDLSLFCCNLEPCLLPMTTGLTRLYLWRVTLQPSQAQQDSALGASQLLQLLARLTALQELRLADISWPQQLLAPYSALTASSNLRGLHICDCDMQGAVWAHVFPAGRKLPQLRLFSSDKFLCQDPTPFGSADISRLVSCCPAVEELTFTPAADASLALLRSLTELKSLYCGSVSPAVIRSDLAALSQLRRLGLSVSLPAAGAGEDESAGLQHLLHLTALTCLTSSCLGSHAGWLSSKAPAGAPPDVWVQLLEKCAADQAAQPAVIISVVQQLQEQREQVTQLQQQHTEDLAAARAEAAELRGQMQALAGQLQQVMTALRQQQQA